MNKYLPIGLVLLLGTTAAYAQESQIPSWIKSNAKWWSENTIGDSDFVSGIQYLIQKGIIKVPATASQSNVLEIPTWVKNNAGWWADGKIADSDFLSGIQYLVKGGIINVNTPAQAAESVDTSKCDSMTTAADKRTCIKEIKEAQAMQEDIAKATETRIGSVMYYLVDARAEKTGQGTILSINLIVKNTGSGDVDLFCTGPAACNYSLFDGKTEIVYTVNTLTSGHLLLKPDAIKRIDWVFYKDLKYDSSKDYFLKVKEPWGTGQIPLNLD
ncbi:MAG TPA: hypothetical protein VLA53_06980 [Nitrosopumilaceae archaeon]|nr:hypothetical protein [Nitrosopumilaceae archaeon]